MIHRQDSEDEEGEGKENEYPDNLSESAVTPSNSRSVSPFVDDHQADQVNNTEVLRTETSRLCTPSRSSTPLLDTSGANIQLASRSNDLDRNAMPSPVVDLPQEPKESKRIKIVRLEGKIEILTARIERRDRKIVKLERMKLELEANVQNAKSAVPLDTDNYQLPEYMVAQAKTFKTVREFTAPVILMVFSKEERKNHTLYGA
ncbi:hypothetical protein QAD02_021951 [Eretmocerus hayati]|uniref:Uncharacterized protein n=1 Tax=Eretmocerus hayati TaxID=131215 RepID=A0ACC2PUV9_9HYME|nr:hypothetical protein QAD02_021951 [Eretmocerus hayati]